MPEDSLVPDKDQHDLTIINSTSDDIEPMRKELLSHIRVGLYKHSKQKKDAYTHLGYIDRYIKLLYPNLSTKHKLTDEEAKSLKLTKDGDKQSIEAKNIPLSEVMEAVRKTNEVRIEGQHRKAD